MKVKNAKSIREGPCSEAKCNLLSSVVVPKPKIEDTEEEDLRIWERVYVVCMRFITKGASLIECRVKRI